MYRNLSLKKKKFIDPRWLFAVGLIISALVTYSEVAHLCNPDFEILRTTTVGFWHGSVPYGEKGEGLFLYGPLFSIIFTPFAFLPAGIAPYLWNIFNFCLFFCLYSLCRTTSRLNRSAGFSFFCFLWLLFPNFRFVSIRLPYILHCLPFLLWKGGFTNAA